MSEDGGSSYWVEGAVEHWKERRYNDLATFLHVIPFRRDLCQMRNVL